MKKRKLTLIKIFSRTMDRCRRFFINKLGGIPSDDIITFINKYKYEVEHVTYPTIKLAREHECPNEEKIISYTEGELARDFGISLLDTGLIQIERHHGHEGNVVLRAVLEVVDKRGKGI